MDTSCEALVEIRLTYLVALDPEIREALNTDDTC